MHNTLTLNDALCIIDCFVSLVSEQTLHLTGTQNAKLETIEHLQQNLLCYVPIQTFGLI